MNETSNRPNYSRKAVLLVFGIPTLLGLLYWGYCEIGWRMVYSDGTRTGIVQKFSKKGSIAKTWEGTLNQGTISVDPKTGEAHGWEFSVADESVVPLVQAAEKAHKPVTLYYKQRMRKLWYKGDTDYFIYKVE